MVSLTKPEAGPLPVTVDVFQADTHNPGVVLIGDEQLAVEGSEFSIGCVPFESAGAFSHFIVGEPDSWHFEVGILFFHVLHECPRDRVCKLVEGSPSQILGNQAMGMAMVIAKFEVGEF